MVDVGVREVLHRPHSAWSTALVAVTTVGSLLAILTGGIVALSLNTFTTVWNVQVPVREAGAFTSADYTRWQHLAIDVFDHEWLVLEGTDRWTTAMATAPHWVALPVMGLIGLVLVPVLRSVSAGRRLTGGDAARLVVVAGLVAAGWAASIALPFVVATRAIAAEQDGLSAAYFVPVVSWTWWPLLVAALVALLAAAVWQGARAARDVEGLV